MEPTKITDEDYEHFLRMWERSGSKNLGDLTELYVKDDTLQLADVFENFIDVSVGKYGLDPSYYVSAPHLSNDAMLKVTGAEIELLTDPGMYLFFEESKRGGKDSRKQIISTWKTTTRESLARTSSILTKTVCIRAF